MYFRDTNSKYRACLALGGTTIGANRFSFRQYNAEETSNGETTLAAGTYFEEYVLPKIATGLTQSPGAYEIVTTKHIEHRTKEISSVEIAANSAYATYLSNLSNYTCVATWYVQTQNSSVVVVS